MTIKTESELLLTFPDNVLREITPEQLRDFVQSTLAIGGTMYANNVPISVTTNYNPSAPFPAFTNSIDTKGLTEDLTMGHFTIETGAGGTYSVEANLCISSPFNGELTMAIVKNGSLTPYEVTYTVTNGVKVPFPIGGTGNLADGDTVGLAIKGSGAATVTLVHGQLRVFRI